MPYSCGVCVFDGEGILTYVSRMIDKFGTASDVVGKPVWQSCEDEHHVRHAFAECLLTGQPVRADSVTVAPDGTRFRFRYTFHALPRGKDHRVATVWYQPTIGQALATQELECLRLLADGMHQSEIAERQFVSESTVKSALFRARAKLNARTNTQAVALAARHGLL